MPYAMIAYDTGFYFVSKTAFDMLKLRKPVEDIAAPVDEVLTGKKKKSYGREPTLVKQLTGFVISDVLWEMYIKDMWYNYVSDSMPDYANQTVWRISKALYIGIMMNVYFRLMGDKKALNFSRIIDDVLIVGGAELIGAIAEPYYT